MTAAHDVRDYGPAGDPAALQLALDAAGRADGGTRLVHVPAATSYVTDRPFRFRAGVSVTGGGWSMDETWHAPTALVADPSFVGAAILQLDPAGATLPGTGEPDLSWHWGVIERLAVIGTGPGGPHGIDPGWGGEASTIRNVTAYTCDSGIHLAGPQASTSLHDVSLFGNAVGLNCDGIASTVRAVGLSGDNNGSLLRVKGGLSTNVTVVSLKAESYQPGTGDPLIDIIDLDGGSVTVVGGWADTDAARTRVVRISETEPMNRPRLTLTGFGAHTGHYQHMIEDTVSGTTAPVLVSGLSRGSYSWNQHHYTGGQGRRAVTGPRDDGTALASLLVALAANGLISDETW